MRVARVEFGGDVARNPAGMANLKQRLTRRAALEKISVSMVRHGVGLKLYDVPTDDRVLHRLIINEVGRPIEEYKTPQELLEGIRDAVEGKIAIPLSVRIRH